MTEFMEFIADMLLFAGGMLTMGFVMLPHYMESWCEGYKTAEKLYSNWDLGFKQGFEAGVTAALQELERKSQYEHQSNN